MAAPLARWGVNVTWTPDPTTYSSQTRTIYFLVDSSLSTSAQSAKAAAMALDQCGMLDAQNPSVQGTPFLDSDQRDYDRNGNVI